MQDMELCIIVVREAKHLTHSVFQNDPCLRFHMCNQIDLKVNTVIRTMNNFYILSQVENVKVLKSDERHYDKTGTCR